MTGSSGAFKKWGCRLFVIHEIGRAACACAYTTDLSARLGCPPLFAQARILKLFEMKLARMKFFVDCCFSISGGFEDLYAGGEASTSTA